MIRGFSTAPAAPAVVAPAAEAQSAVSWDAIWAGAVAALAVSITLTAVASGFGLTLAMPGGASPRALDHFAPTVGAIAVTVQVLSAGLGGYLAGRLRISWTGIHSHETHFRDTAHGLLVWAVSTVAGIILAVAVVGPFTERVQDVALTQSAESQAHGSAAGPGAAVVPPPPRPDPALADRADDIAAQISLFTAIGMMLSAFIAAVAAAIGGGRRDDMAGRV